MIGFVIAAAAAIDALAAGVVIGRSTASKALPVSIAGAMAPVEAAVSKVEAVVEKEAAVVVAHNPQHIAAAEAVLPTDVAAVINAKLDTLLAKVAPAAPTTADLISAQAATAPK